jgi:transposase
MPHYNNPRRTWQYTNQFKAKTVQLSLIEGIQAKPVAETLDIHPMMLSRWRKEYREEKIVADKPKKVIYVKKQKAELTKVKSLNKKINI